MAGGEVDLATLWLPVAPSTEGLDAKFREIGEKGRRAFDEGFKAQGGFDQMFSGLTQQTNAVTQSMSGLATHIGAISGLVSSAVSLSVQAIEHAVTETVHLVEKGAELIVDSVVHIGESWEHISDQMVLFGHNQAELSSAARNIMQDLDAPADKLGQDLALLNDRLDLTGPALEGVGKHIEELRRMGLQDIDQLTEGMNTFGISTDQVDNSLGALLQTQQRFGTNMNVIIGQLGREADALQDIGLSYGQSVYMLGEVDAKSQKAGDALGGMIAKAQKNAQAHHETVGEYFTDELATIKHYHDIGRDDLANQEAMAAFGVRRWVDAKIAAEAYIDTMKQDPKTLEGNAADIDKAAKATEHIDQAWERLKNKFIATFGPAFASVLDMFTEGLNNISKWFDANSVSIVATVKEWGDTFIQSLPKIQFWAGEAVKLIGQFVTFTIHGVGMVAEILGELFGNEKLEKFGRTLTNIDFTPLTDKIGNAIQHGFHLDPATLNKMQADWDAKMPKLDGKADLKTPDGTSLFSNGLPPKLKENMTEAGKAAGEGFVNGFTSAAEEHLPGWLKTMLKFGLGSALAPDTPENRDKYWHGGTGPTTDPTLPHPSGSIPGEKVPPGQAPPSGQWTTSGGETEPELPGERDPQPRRQQQPAPDTGTLGPAAAGGGPSMPVQPGDGVGGAGGLPAHTSSYTTNTGGVVLAGWGFPLPPPPPVPAPPVTGPGPLQGHPGMPAEDDPTSPSYDHSARGRKRREHDDKIWSAQDNLATANDDLTTARKTTVDADKTLNDLKQSGAKENSEGYIAALKDSVKAHREEQAALHRVIKSQDDYDEAVEGGAKEKKESSSGGPAQEFGSQFLGGIMDSLGLGGVLGGKSPLQWGSVKAGLGVLQFGLGMAQSMGLGPFAQDGGGGARDGGSGTQATHPYAQQGQPNQAGGNQPGGIPAIAQPNIRSQSGWGFGPKAQVPQGTTLAGFTRPPSGAIPAMPIPGMGGFTTAAATTGGGPAGPVQLATSGSGGGDPASTIVAEGRRRGYSDSDIQWILADSIGESSLSPGAKNGDHIGLFQQDASYPGRDTMQGQVTGFYDRLDKTNPKMSIGDRISRTPAEGGVEGGGYGPDWIAKHLGQAGSLMSNGDSGGQPAAANPSGSGLSGSALGRFAESLPARPGEEHLQPASTYLRRELFNQFPELQSIGGWREKDPFIWHPSGRALDVMIPGQGGLNDPTTPEGLAEGNKIHSWLEQNADAFGIQMDGTLWQQRDHYNHIHVQLAGPMPGGDSSAPGGFQLRQPPQQPQSGQQQQPPVQQHPTQGGGGQTFGQSAMSNLAKGLSVFMGAGGPDKTPPTQISNDYSISMHDNTLSDHKAFVQQMQEQQNSRYRTVSGGLPYSSVGSP